MRNILTLKRKYRNNDGVVFDYRINLPKGYEIYQGGNGARTLKIVIKPIEKSERGIKNEKQN